MFTQFRSGLAIFLIACTITMAGCVSNAGWHYTPNEPVTSPTHVPLTLGVQRFKDDRAILNSTYFWVCMIPLVPYCTADYHRPDTANGFLSAGAYNFRPSADLADATAKELSQSQIFHDVFVTDRAHDPGAQLVLEGTVHDTDWNGTLYAYLIGPYKALAFLLGLPFGTANNTLNLDLRLLQQSNGAVLWNYKISESYTRTEGYYYNYGEDFGYAEMFRSGIKGAISSLEQYVQSQPPSFWDAMRPSGPGEKEGKSN
jgi:hypothetical protein